MAYRSNPFLERMSERTTSDQEFVRLFSPKILERLPEDALEGAVHIYRSPPGGGKTTLLRALTPSALHAFWNARRTQDMSEAYQRLVARGVLDEQGGPQVLGVMLSCASGYADLPPGATFEQEGLFRALLDCRIVLRALRSFAILFGAGFDRQLEAVRLTYADAAQDLKSIPLLESAHELARWAEDRERSVYGHLDSFATEQKSKLPTHVQFEGVLWLQYVNFELNGKHIAPKRLLMIDDLHKLRQKQRALLIRELTELRPRIPVWLAERSIALGEQLLTQGAREGRDLRQHELDDLWSSGRGQHQFATYAQNILDRRLTAQSDIPAVVFAQYLRSQFQSEEFYVAVQRGIESFRSETKRHQAGSRYANWLRAAETSVQDGDVDAYYEVLRRRILIARDEARKQMTLELAPLSEEEFDERDSSQIHGAAEIFAHEELGIPYYFGIERLCVMATNNVEELLALAAALFEGLRAKQVLRKVVLLSPAEQEKLLKDVAKRKYEFIPKAHTEGTRAQQLLNVIGDYCRRRTFLPSAPYAPGVTGVRLSQSQLLKLNAEAKTGGSRVLRKVLAECVAENLLIARESASSTSRDSGTIFYLNRTLCAHYGLPLQMGGWQDVEVEDMVDWMEHGRVVRGTRRLGIG